MRSLCWMLPMIAAIAISGDIAKTSHAEAWEWEARQWLGIYSGDDKIGYSQITYTESKGGRAQIEERTKIKMTVLGTEQEVVVESSYQLDAFLLRSFQFSMQANSVKIKAKGRREGDIIAATVLSVSGQREISIPSPTRSIASPAVYRWLSRQTPAAGKSYRVSLFDPSAALTGANLAGAEATLDVSGEEEITIPAGTFKTFKVRMTSSAGEILTWITDDGKIVKQTSPPGITAIAETEQKALGDKLSSLDIIQKTAISVDAPLSNSRKLRFLRVKVSGLGSAQGLNLSDGYRQRYEDGVIEVRVQGVNKLNSYSIPYSGGDLSHYLRASDLIQSGAEEIIGAAAKILRAERDSLKAARRINRWVYKNLRKTPTVSFPNALDVLKTRAGDCTEHATLYAALARAAGVPVKIALGVVFLDGKFYYHAWNEVFVGEWVAADPTLGQFPADASHIKFLEGDFGNASELSRFIGNIEFEIKEAR
ncbi:MAG: transglutaminase domain-containing protein [Deltaproteobacteria bacterium]